MTTLTAHYAAKNADTPARKAATVPGSIFAHFGKVQKLLVASLTTGQQGADQLHRLADSFEASQPNLAAELRAIVCRG